MRDDTTNWYKPSSVKISKLSDEEIEAYKKKKAERSKEEIAKNKLLKLDIDGYTYSISSKKKKRIKK